MVAVEDLSTLLWRQHELLDLLLFKAGEKQYIVVSDQMRWLPRISAEIEAILTEMRALETERIALVAEFAREHELLTDSPSLREMATIVGEPWSQVLMTHHENLLKAVTDLRTLSEVNKGLIEKGMEAINESLRLVTAPGAGTYTATGQAAGDAPVRAVALDGAL